MGASASHELTPEAAAVAVAEHFVRSAVVQHDELLPAATAHLLHGGALSNEVVERIRLEGRGAASSAAARDEHEIASLAPALLQLDPLLARARHLCVPSRLPEATIPSYSMVDDGALCKVLIPFAGAGALAAGALTVDFRDRSFDLRAVSDGKVWRLHVPLLHEEINQHECGCRVRPGKLIVRLAKRDGSKGWYELRKTKGVGDTEWHKLVPDAGESVVVTI